jgi:hypothetical protein
MKKHDLSLFCIYYQITAKNSGFFTLRVHLYVIFVHNIRTDESRLSHYTLLVFRTVAGVTHVDVGVVRAVDVGHCAQ